MSARARSKSSSRLPGSKGRPWLSSRGIWLALIVAGVLVAFWLSRRVATRPTFNKDIAPLVFSRCSSCHRPGQAAPFSLLTYDDVKRHAGQIAEVTRTRYMPPWLAEPGYGQFANVRRLSDQELALLQRWIADGCREGALEDLPPAPKWADDWMLGTPDLVVRMPEPYTLAAEGRDIFRNFVFSIPVTTARYVRAVELNPRNRRILHHALIKVDRTAQSRQIDQQDREPGFPGMKTGAEMPDGHFLTWQPGRIAAPLPEGLNWILEPGSDLVLETHLNPSGKPELFQPEVGLYFTNRAPTNVCLKMALTSRFIDIPAGQSDYMVRDSFTLPADVDLLAVLPHAHYIATDIRAWAVLPDGKKESLIWIQRWDFNWQSDYRYVTPLFLPKGTTLHAEFKYDNSTANERSLRPLRRVRYGLQSQDEMAELWLQLLPRHEADRPALTQSYGVHLDRVYCEAAEYVLRLDPLDVRAHLDLGLHLPSQGRTNDAFAHLLKAAELQPANDEPHYLLGILMRRQDRIDEARAEFEQALRLNPGNAKAHGNLGFISEEQGRLDEAEAHYRACLRLNPYDALARSSLEELLRQRGRVPRKP